MAKTKISGRHFLFFRQMNKLLLQLKKIKQKQPGLAALKTADRNSILINLSALIRKHQKQILSANAQDLKNLKRNEMRDRLVLNPKRLQAMAQGLLDVAKLLDPLNKVLVKKRLKNGLNLQKVSVPLGTIGVIYESRPNVTIDLAGLAIKSGNALVLKGGSEAYNSNKILVGLVHRALKSAGLPADLVYLISPKENWQKTLLNAHGLVDVLIPRGSENLIDWVRKNSRLPVIETGAGVCHTFVDENVDAKKAAAIVVNAKIQRPDVCNALDTLVIHQKSLKSVLQTLAKSLVSRVTLDTRRPDVEIFADPDSYGVLQNIYPSQLLKKAKPSDFGHEFLSLKMSIKTVKSFEEGLKFIKEKTSGHSEAILSKNQKHIKTFLKEVDAACVYANASTRFTDGGEFDMGAEVGISTQKLHARGPMGLEALTSYKWIATGNWLSRK